ncbi:hypothetical protein MCOR08_006885 [Pyricularia oryzae]|nr:hypothetical protein MCOR08_006885 [Pyricularia oryzae]
MFAEKPVAIVPFDDSVALPDDVKALCDKVDDIGSGFGVIPALIFTNIVDEGKKISAGEKIRPVYSISQDQDQDLNLGSGPASKAALLRELDLLCDVVKESQRASPGGYSEAHWNTRVHSAIMVAAIEADTPRDKRLAQVFDTTAAGIASGCIPRNVNGRSLEAKMVDYCIVLSDPDIRQRCTGAVVANMQPSKVRRTKPSATSSASSVSAPDNNSIAGSTQTRPATDDRMHPNSINHSEYYPLRDQPIAVSIETKKPNGSDEEAKTQLSVWVSAHLLRLHQLFNKPQPIPLWLPLLYVRGSQWQLCFAVEREHCILDLKTDIQVDVSTFANLVSGSTEGWRLLAGPNADRARIVATFMCWFVEPRMRSDGDPATTIPSRYLRCLPEGRQIHRRKHVTTSQRPMMGRRELYPHYSTLLDSPYSALQPGHTPSMGAGLLAGQSLFSRLALEFWTQQQQAMDPAEKRAIFEKVDEIQKEGCIPNTSCPALVPERPYENVRCFGIRGLNIIPGTQIDNLGDLVLPTICVEPFNNEYDRKRVSHLQALDNFDKLRAGLNLDFGTSFGYFCP